MADGSFMFEKGKNKDKLSINSDIKRVLQKETNFLRKKDDTRGYKHFLLFFLTLGGKRYF